MQILNDLSAELPVLIAGPTASGKSALALEVASRQGGVIVNADALQVYANWRLLTARPSEAEEEIAPHLLYGHVAWDLPYSVGDWLREVAGLLAGPDRLIIVGGTGLYFSALTEGLADIPITPPNIRAEADDRLATEGPQALLRELDAATLARIDMANPVRVQRAWEVQRSTGRGLADWQDNTPTPALPLARAQPLVIEMDRDRLAERIQRRFDQMLADGVLKEARENLADWSPKAPSAKAIGAAELIGYLRGELSLSEAREKSIFATRQFAKRQRTWFRNRMKDWARVVPAP